MQGHLKKYEHYLGSPETSWNWIFRAGHKHLYSILKNCVGDFATHWRLRTSRAVFCKVKYAHKSPGDLMKMQIVVHGIMRLEIASAVCSCHTDAAVVGPLFESGDARLDGERGPVQFWTALIPANWEGFTVSPKWAPPRMCLSNQPANKALPFVVSSIFWIPHVKKSDVFLLLLPTWKWLYCSYGKIGSIPHDQGIRL